MNEIDYQIEGAKGGKGGGGGATESPDNLRATQIAEILDIISEGEAEGLVDGLKSVYLDGVPIQNDDETFNFENINLGWTSGTQGQAALPGMSGVSSEFAVGVLVDASTPVVRTITNPDVDAIRVTINIPQLSYQSTDSGNLSGTAFEYAIDVQSNGGGYVNSYQGTVAGKTMSAYTRSIEVQLNGSAPWDVRLRRLTPDATGSNVVDKFYWSSYTAIQAIKLRYPNTAMMMLRVNAQQFSSVPTRAYDWMGMRIKVPSNYNTRTLEYTGVWDGTFKIDWTCNPAWIYFDMVTNTRYGLGNFVDASQINKWNLYEIARYCDGMVPDGSGGLEPRFQCHVAFYSRDEAFKVLQDLTAVFRGMAFWAGNTIEISQDAPQEASLLFTPSNVVDGNFTYQDASDRGMHSVFICWWNDLSQMGKRIPEVYAPTDLIQRYGMREIELSPIGVTSRGQAARLCRWARHSEQSEGMIVGFNVGSDGAVVAPGKIFKIADPSVAGERLGGRILTATTGSVTLDAPVELREDETYTITVLRADPANRNSFLTEERTITTAPGANITTVDVSPSFTSAPETQTVFVLQSTGISSTTWRCLSVTEVDGKNEYQISGIAHNPSKYDAIELGLALDEQVTTRVKTTVLPPTNLQLLETVYNDGTVNRSKLTISWSPSAPGLRHFVSYRTDTGWWQKLPDTTEQTVDIPSLDPGVYDVIVRSGNLIGSVSAATQASITIAGGKTGIRSVRLKASSSTFKVPTSGIAAPSIITLTADIGALTNAPTFAVVSGTATLSGTGLTRTVSYSDMSTETVSISATVTESGQTYSDMITLFKVRDGAAGETGDPGTPGAPGTPGTPGSAGAPAVSAQMTLDAIALPADSDGAVTSYTGASSSMVLLLGSTVDTTNWSFSHVPSSGITVTRSTSTITITAMASGTDSGYVDITATRSGYSSITKRVSISKTKSGASGSAGSAGLNAATVFLYQRNDTGTAPAVPGTTLTYTFATGVLSGTLGGWTQTVPASAGGKYLFVTTASALASTATDTIAAAEWATVRILAQDGTNGTVGSNGTNGTNGTSAAAIYIYQRAASAPTLPSVTTTFTFASGVLTGLNNGWTTTLPAGSNPLYVSIATATGSGATDTIAAGEWAAPVILVQNGTNGDAGVRGSVTLSAATTGTSWSDSAANAALTAAGYAAPVNLDMVTLFNATTGFAETRFRSGTSWLTVQAYITGNMVVDGTIGAKAMVIQGGVGGSIWMDPNVTDSSAWVFAGTGVIPTFTTTTTGDTGEKIMSGGAGGASADGWPMVPVSSTKQYRVSARVRAVGGANGTFSLRYVYGTTARGTKTQVSPAATNAITPTTSWVRYSFEVVVPSTYKFISPRILLNVGGTAGSHEAQDIRIEEMLDSSLVVQGGINADRLNVTSLSAITATIGTLRTSTTGARMEISDNTLKVFDAGGTLRVHIGDLSL